MKLISATLLPLVLLTNSVRAQPTSQSASPAPVQSQTQLATASASGTGDEAKKAEQRNLESCEAEWNEKLRKNHRQFEQTKAYRSYYDKWKDSPAQRPPRLPILEPTRTSYRQYMADCLRDSTAMYPLGLRDEK